MSVPIVIPYGSGGSSVTEVYKPYVTWTPVLYYYANSSTSTLTSLSTTKYGLKYFADNAHFIMGMSGTQIAVCVWDGGYPRVISTLTISSISSSYDYFTVFDDGTYRLISLGSSVAANNTYLVIVASDWSMSLATTTASTVIGYVQAFNPSGTYLLRGTQVMTVDKATGATTGAVSVPYTSSAYRGIWVDDTHIILCATNATIGLYLFDGSTFTLVGSTVSISGIASTNLLKLSTDGTKLFHNYGGGSSTGLLIYSISISTGLLLLASKPCLLKYFDILEVDSAYYLIGGHVTAGYFPYSQAVKILKSDYTESIIDVDISHLYPNYVGYNSANGFCATQSTIVGALSPIQGQAQGAYLWRGDFTESTLVDIEYNSNTYRVVGDV